MNQIVKLNTSPRANFLLGYIKTGCLVHTTIPPQAWQAASTLNDVLDWNIKTKENIYDDDPKKVMKDKSGVSIQLFLV